jgi:predicted phage gp36 major capsid-like protein
MKATLILLAALWASLAWSAPAGAQPSRPGASASFAQAERNSVELKQGMTLEEVQKLLGKPKRTALRNTGSSAGEPWQGTLQWTYAWSPERTLHVVFAAKTPEQWYVNSWDWSNY